MNLPRRRLAALLAASAIALAGCGGGSSGKAKTSPSGSGIKTKVGVSVTGSFGQKPTLTVPSGAAPASLSTDVLTQGSGAAVKSGQTLVANYLGQTWDPQAGKANVFDNSYDQKAPVGFQIGTGAVIPGWDKTLVGQKAGTRLLLTIPPAQAYGAQTSSSQPLAGHTLLFVVDVIGSIDKNTAATGNPVSGPLPAGMPAIQSESGKKPVITSVKGVKKVTAPASALLLRGTGAAIDSTKTLALELVQTDAATGKNTQQTWGSGLQLFPASQVLSVAEALKGQKIGSRAVVLTPADSSSGTAVPAAVLIVDVVGQY